MTELLTQRQRGRRGSPQCPCVPPLMRGSGLLWGCSGAALGLLWGCSGLQTEGLEDILRIYGFWGVRRKEGVETRISESKHRRL